MGYKVKLNSFEGPFDLLVYLIENARMSIYDIQVAEITSQYLDYIGKMQETDVQVASEFMVLAATLIEIKSKMIIPRSGFDGEILVEEDPRSELVERILEYKRFKLAAEILELQEERMSHIYEKPQEDLSRYTNAPDEYLNLDIKQFVNAFNNFLQKKHKLEYIKRHYARVERQKTTMENKIAFIRDFFEEKEVTSVNFSELISDEPDRYNKVLTFASLLEMVRERAVALFQKRPYADIRVDKIDSEAAKKAEEEAIKKFEAELEEERKIIEKREREIEDSLPSDEDEGENNDVDEDVFSLDNYDGEK
ncbi:MAG: segregation/condensation protein A [Clostridia bacterium]|nr:segregation/condensation protein A [Clostridia bacterium]